jgi:mono/diheme cytochrome c family protein
MGRILRILGIILGLIIVLLVILVGYIFVASNAKINTSYEVSGISIDIPDDEDSVAEGERIFLSRSCADCHTEDGGGNPTWLDDPALGTFGTANLTSGEGGVGQTYEA